MGVVHFGTCVGLSRSLFGDQALLSVPGTAQSTNPNLDLLVLQRVATLMTVTNLRLSLNVNLSVNHLVMILKSARMYRNTIGLFVLYIVARLTAHIVPWPLI